MEKVYIYTLSHPITGVVKYIGKSIDPKDRLRGHIRDARTKRRDNLSSNWIKSLLKEGLEPKMDIIDEIDGEWEWLEQYWISQFKSWGFVLKNTTDGGDYNPMTSPIARKKVSDAMKKIEKTPEWCANISKGKKGKKVHTDEQKVNYSLMNSGEGNPMFGKKHNKKSLSKMKIKVHQYSLDGDFIKTWDSAADVDRETEWKARSINRCAKGDRKTAYGYIWIYENKKGRG
jgi:group I intron endonuclease